MRNGKGSEKEFPYQDIIDLPHYEPKRHPRMNQLDRAAQFASFSALRGHAETLLESERLTECKLELDESELRELNEVYSKIKENLPKHPFVKLTYFVPDLKKEGGSYQTVSGYVTKLDNYGKCLQLDGERKVPFRDIYQISCVL